MYSTSALLTAALPSSPPSSEQTHQSSATRNIKSRFFKRTYSSPSSGGRLDHMLSSSLTTLTANDTHAAIRNIKQEVESILYDQSDSSGLEDEFWTGLKCLRLFTAGSASMYKLYSHLSFQRFSFPDMFKYQPNEK